MLLTLDTSSPQVAVALHHDDEILIDLVSEQTMKHGEQLAPLIEQAMRQAGIVRHDLTAIGVGVGPGPFTGLRVGLVTARTLAYVLDLPVYGVCSLDVLALQASPGRPFAVATDARRKEVYFATYDEDARRLDGPIVDKPGVLATDLLVVGEGGVLYPEAFPNTAGPARPSAAWLAHAIAEERAELLDPDPLYLRRPDAEQPSARKQVS